MNWNLKKKIHEKYRFQADFAQDHKLCETLVSKIVMSRRKLPPQKQRQWAEWLNCRAEDIFGGDQIG